MPAELLRIATAGSVDDGKSTLIGRLLLDSKQLYDDQLEALSAGELAQVTDGLRAEREQGITIDVAYRYFSTPERSFILADTPGHERYTRNMVTGASTAQVALILVDARHGLLEQSYRHAHLSALLGIRHLVACVNKMDLVGWDEGCFRALERDFHHLADAIGVADAYAIPVSALHGDNVVDRSKNIPWYGGPTLLEHLERLEIVADEPGDDIRLPVQWVIRDGRHRAYAGQLAGGTIRAGDEVVALPEGARTQVEAVETHDGPVPVAFAPMVVRVRLSDQLDVARGTLLAAPASPPVPATDLRATICWLGERPARVGSRFLLKHTSRRVHATVEEILARTDVVTLEGSPAEELGLNDIAEVRLRTSAPVMADTYADNRATGAFILIDERTHDTVAAGMVREAREESAREAVRSRDVRWHSGGVPQDERRRLLDQSGATLWFTGLPASGKSTIAVALERVLVEEGRFAYLIDGDNVRHGLSADLGFDPLSRTENIRRVGHVARLFADAGAIALVSLVSPMRPDRDAVRKLHAEGELPFLEVWVDTPVEVCAERDPKGLYARSKAGRVANFTGDTAPYEAPLAPELTVRTVEESVEAAVERLRAALPPR